MNQDGMLRMLDLMREVPATRRTLRFYEEQGLLCPAGKDRYGRRVYQDSDVQRLRLIRDLRAAGLSLGAIRDLLDSRVPRPDDTNEDIWLDRLADSLKHQLVAVGVQLEDVRRVYDELLESVRWLRGHRDQLLSRPGAGTAPDVQEGAPTLLRTLLNQPLLLSPTPVDPFADESELLHT